MFIQAIQWLQEVQDYTHTHTALYNIEKASGGCVITAHLFEAFRTLDVFSVRRQR